MPENLSAVLTPPTKGPPVHTWSPLVAECCPPPDKELKSLPVSSCRLLPCKFSSQGRSLSWHTVCLGRQEVEAKCLEAGSGYNCIWVISGHEFIMATLMSQPQSLQHPCFLVSKPFPPLLSLEHCSVPSCSTQWTGLRGCTMSLWQHVESLAGLELCMSSCWQPPLSVTLFNTCVRPSEKFPLAPVSSDSSLSLPLTPFHAFSTHKVLEPSSGRRVYPPRIWKSEFMGYW